MKRNVGRRCADVSTQSRETFIGEGRHEGSLSDSIGSKAFTIHVDAQLLFLFSVLSDITYTLDASQPISHFVAVFLEFAIRTFVAF